MCRGGCYLEGDRLGCGGVLLLLLLRVLVVRKDKPRRRRRLGWELLVVRGLRLPLLLREP